MKALLFVAVLIGTLALFNSGEADFADFIRERAQDVVGDNARSLGGNILGGAVGALAGEVAGAIAGGSVERSNFLVLSTYTLDLNGASAEGGEWKFLGIGGQFFELERPALVSD